MRHQQMTNIQDHHKNDEGNIIVFGNFKITQCFQSIAWCDNLTLFRSRKTSFLLGLVTIILVRTSNNNRIDREACRNKIIFAWP